MGDESYARRKPLCTLVPARVTVFREDPAIDFYVPTWYRDSQYHVWHKDDLGVQEKVDYGKAVPSCVKVK